jgi:hypothetical protein
MPSSLTVPPSCPNVIRREGQQSQQTCPLDSLSQYPLVPCTRSRTPTRADPCTLCEVSSQHGDVLVVYDDLLLHAESAHAPPRWIEAPPTATSARSSAWSGTTGAASGPRCKSTGASCWSRWSACSGGTHRCGSWCLIACRHICNGPPRCQTSNFI